MHQLIARFLLLVALAGNLAPLAMATAATPPHACCIRKAAHRCHDSAGLESEQLAIRAASACNHDCCRAVTTAQWAHQQPPVNRFCALTIADYLGPQEPVFPNTKVSASQSTRAPPRFSIS